MDEKITGHIALREIACSAASFRQIDNGLSAQHVALPSDISIKLLVNVRPSKETDDRVKVELRVILESNAEAGQLYDVDVTYWGDFQLGDLPDGLTPDRFARQNAIAIMFPYVREAISSLTGRGSAGPVFLPPINIVALVGHASEKALPPP